MVVVHTKDDTMDGEKIVIRIYEAKDVEKRKNKILVIC